MDKNKNEENPWTDHKVIAKIRGLPAHGVFAENLVVQNTPDHFILTFFSIQHPIDLPFIKALPEKSDGSELPEVDAMVSAKLIVTPRKMEEFIEAMIANLSSYKKALAAIIEEGENDNNT